MFFSHASFFEKEIPNEMTEEAEQIKRMIDTFNIEELKNFIEDDQKLKKIQESTILFEHMMEKIQENIKQIVVVIANDSRYDCSQILDFMNQFLRRSHFPSLKDQFSLYKNLLNIIEYTDCLLIYEKVNEFFYHQPKYHIHKSDYYFLRFIHLEKILYEHINYLSEQKINLIDYYQEDPKYVDNGMNLRIPLQFNIQYNEPTQLEESYENISNNNKLQGPYQYKNLQIVDDDSISALTLSRNLLNKHDQPLSPLIEIVKYRILIKRGLKNNPQLTKNIIIRLHQKASIILLRRKKLLNQIHEDRFGIYAFSNSIIKDVKKTDYLNLFKLETIDPLLLIELLDTFSQQNEQFYEKNQLQKLLLDVLSMKQIEQNELTEGYPLKYYPKILSENQIRNEQLTCSILKYFSKNLLNQIQFWQDDNDGIIKLIINSLNIEDNRMLLPPEQFNLALQYLSYKISGHHSHKNNENLNILLQIVKLYIFKVFILQKPSQNGYVQINENDADIIVNACIMALNRQICINFQDVMLERHNLNNYNSDIIYLVTSKISSSNVLNLIANQLQQSQQFTQTFNRALQLINSLLNSNFQLIDKILNSNLPNILNEKIIGMSIQEITPEIIFSINQFYANITKREQINQFIYYGKRFLELLINYQLITKDNSDDQSLFNLALCLIKYYQKNDRNKILIHEILVKVLSQLLEQLNNQQQSLNFDQDFESEFQKIQKKKNQILYFNWKLCNFFNENFKNYLNQNGYFDMLANLFKIPNFTEFISVAGFNSVECVEKALQLIDEWERELGCSLEKATFLSFNKKIFLENCSIQIYQIASRFSEILHYLSQVLDLNNTAIFQTYSSQLSDKCCALLEIVLVAENENKSASNLLFQLLRKVTMNNNTNNWQPISRLLIRLILESNNHPAMTLKLLKTVNNYLQSFNNSTQIIKNIITNSQFISPLQDLIKNYILLINTDSSNKQLIDEQGKDIFEILRTLYTHIKTNPQCREDLQIIPKIISDIISLIQIIKNSTHESIKKIQQFLLNKANLFANPQILDIPQDTNIPINLRQQPLITQLEQIGYQRRNLRLITTDQYIQFVRQNQARPETQGALIQQNDEQILQQVKAQQEQIKLLFKQNIDFVKNFDILNQLQLQLNVSEMLSILQLSVEKEFNLSLQFQGIEIEMSNQIDYNLKSIILILNLLQNQEKQLQQHQSLDSIATELLKLLNVLLQQADDKLIIKAVNYTLAILRNLITENQNSLSLLLKGVQKTLDSNVQNHITFQICFDILVKVFQKNSLCINLFVQQMRGLELVFNVKANSNINFISLSKLALAIICDKTIIRAQIEAYLKKIIFDQENHEKVQDKNRKLPLQYYQNENAYPICLQHAQYNVKTKEQYKISKMHPALLILQKNQNFKEDITDIMNLLFEESVDNNSLILKKGIRLDTLNSIQKDGNAILQFNFKPKKEAQILLQLLVKQLITSYFDKNQVETYNWNIVFNILQLLISKFPLLLPYILRMNCSQFLEKYQNQIGQENSQWPTNISFLKLIIRFIIPPRNFLFCICLDTLVLLQKQNNIIVPFAYEIRRLITKQLYVDISRSIKSFDEQLLRKSDILVNLLQIKSFAKICILNIKEPQNSYNFIQLYIDGIKNFNIQNYFNQKDQLFFMIKTLDLLYNVATSLILEETEAITTHSLQDYKMGLRIIGQINLREIKCQIFQSDQTYQQIYYNKTWKNDQFQYYLQNWPFFRIENGQFQENTYQFMEQEISADRLQIIPEINNSLKICTKELEEELNYLTDVLDQNLEQETQNNLGIDNNFNNFIKDLLHEKFENQILNTIKFQEIVFPCQFQIILLEFQKRLPLQNNIQLKTSVIEKQYPNYTHNCDQIQNLTNDLNPREVRMQRLSNRYRDYIQNRNQVFGNLQNQNINNNEIIDEQRNQVINIQQNTEMSLQNNQSRNGNIQIENQPQLHQQQQQESNIQTTQPNRSILTQFSKIKNIVNSAMINRKQTLKHLGKIDGQLIQQFFKKFFYIDDDFSSNYDYQSAFLISLGVKGNFNNQIIQDAIRTLFMTPQNQRQENVEQKSIIISKNGVIRDLDYTTKFAQTKALKFLNQLKLTSTFIISNENVKALIELLFKLKGKRLKELLEFLGNQEEKYQLKLTQDEVSNLYQFMIEQKDIKDRTNCIHLISKLKQNTLQFIHNNIIQINRINEYHNNQFLNILQDEQALNQLNEVEKIFQMIQIISKGEEQDQDQFQEFLNSNQVLNLFNILERLISQIQNLYDPRLFPIFKAFLICYQTINKLNTQNQPSLRISSIQISSESIEIQIDFEKLFQRVCLNGRIYINQIVEEQIKNMNKYFRQNRFRNIRENDQYFDTEFVDGILNVHPQLIDFQNKKNYFYSKLKLNKWNSQEINQKCLLTINTSQIFEDSYKEITKISSAQILKYKTFKIRYDEQIGQDEGGITIDWIEKLSKSILDQQYQLFKPNSDNTCNLINMESFNPDHLRKFEFFGKILAIAIICKAHIHGSFPNYFFKHIVGQKLSRSDIQYYDEGIYNSLNVIYNQTIDSSWNLYWLYTIKRDGVDVDEELKPGGKDIEVTEKNKKDFVRKYCYQIMAKNIENQIKAIQVGFYSVIPKEEIKIFDSIQLEQLLCGESYIDVEDLISNLNYFDCTAQHQVIVWLQNTLRKFNQDMLVKFLKFATSRTKIPVGGFQNNECRITIRLLNYLSTDIDSRFPEGHTCTRLIGLPPYSNEGILQKKLEEALIFQGERFDLI